MKLQLKVEQKHAAGKVAKFRWISLAWPSLLATHQYFLAEDASVAMLPASCAYVLVAVSWPTVVSTNWLRRSPSIVAGTATMWVRTAALSVCRAAKYSERCAASVAVRQPAPEGRGKRTSACVTCGSWYQ